MHRSIISSCDHTTISSHPYIIISPYHHVTISSYHHIIISPYHHITISPYHHIITSPYHYITISSYHHNITISSYHHSIISSHHHIGIHFPFFFCFADLAALPHGRQADNFSTKNFGENLVFKIIRGRKKKTIATDRNHITPARDNIDLCSIESSRANFAPAS